MAGHLEVEKLANLGKELGLTGQDLLDFISKERAILEEQRKEERENRAAEREQKRQDEERQREQKRQDEERQREREERQREHKLQYEERQRAHEIKMEEMRLNSELEKQNQAQKSDEAASRVKIEEADNLARIKDEEHSRLLEREEKLVAQQLELEMQKAANAEMMRKSGGSLFGTSKTSSDGAWGPKFPQFDESKDNIDAYLTRYERYAQQQGWDGSKWAVYLGTLLSGKAEDVYHRLDDESASNYPLLKKCILNRYELNSRGFRNKFRNSRPEAGESGPQFATRLHNYFKRWVELSTDRQDKTGIIDLILCDQFLQSIPKEVATFIRERKPKDLDEMTQVADLYITAHGGWWLSSNGGKGKNNKPDKNRNDRTNTNPKKNEAANNKPNSNSYQRKFRGNCFICDKPGHRAQDCRSRQPREKLNAVLETEDEKGTENTVSGKHQTDGNGCSDKAACLRVCTDQVDVIPNQSTYKLDCGHELTVITAACPHQPKKSRIVLVDGYVGKQKVTAMRDSGCEGIVVKESLVKPNQKTDKYVTCILLDGTIRRFQIAMVSINTPYYQGEVAAKICATPVYPLILGQMAGMRDVNNPDSNWVNNPMEGETQVSQDRNEDQDRQLSSEDVKPEIGQHGQNDVGSAVETRSQAKMRNKLFKPLKVPSADNDVVTPEKLKQKQNEDPTLQKIREDVEAKNVKQSRGGGTSTFVKEGGILYRIFQAPNVDYGNPFKQIVVPVDYRKQVMKIAHEAILGGHQGSKKTLDRISCNFYWPGIGADIRRYCQSCDICQRTIPKGKVTKAPLGDMPIIDTPFERVAVDIVGPIKPMTDRGHRYILVLIDYATRYPEAVPLKSIEAEVIAEELMVMFTRLGVPNQILTDQGTQFTSNVMKELNRLLSIKSMVTTPYHAMCNGAVERLNGVLKAGIKKMCEERPKDWDRYICPLLFAFRDTPHSSTGFAPFELMYGRRVRGPMTILSELWTGMNEEGETKNTYQYLIDLQKRLETTCHLAKEEMKKSKSKYKIQYNKKARPREYKEGDEVLLLLPTDANKLLMHWKGPFTIVKKINRMNYQIDLGQRKQTFHINLLKQYFRREKVAAAVDEIEDGAIFDIVAVAVIPEETDNLTDEPDELTNSDDLLHLPPLESKESAKDVYISPDLTADQVKEVKRIFGNCKNVLTDVPGKTNLGEHVIELTDQEPVRCKPYPIPHAVRDDVRKEIDKMLDMGIIRPSTSPYACPLTVVAKQDGSIRICCDTRLLNAKTLFNAEPISDAEEIFSQLSKDNYFTKIDLSKGYWQVPMAEDSKKYTGFVIPGVQGGHYEFNFMPFGLVNSAQTFSKIMRKLLHGLKNVHNYIDDILIHTQTWEEHVSLLKEVMKRLKKTGFTARPTKCQIGSCEIEFLGHVVGKGVMKPRSKKVDDIANAKQPETKTQLRSFLGLVGYYRKFIPNFASVAVPLTDKTRKGEPNKIKWEESQEKAFKSLKYRVTSAPILHLPDLKLTFILRSDASEIGLGAVLLQEREEEKFPIAYASKKMNECQKRYSVMEKECLAIIWAVRKFQTFLFGKEFVIETDHQPLACIKKSKVVNARIMRWALSLQPYRYRLEVIKGSKNIGADYMSRV